MPQSNDAAQCTGALRDLTPSKQNPQNKMLLSSSIKNINPLMPKSFVNKAWEILAGLMYQFSYFTAQCKI